MEMSTRSFIARPSSPSFCNWFFYWFVRCLLEMLRALWKGGNVVRRSCGGRILGNVYAASFGSRCDSCLFFHLFRCIACDNVSETRNTATTPFRSEFLWNPSAKTVYVHTFGCSHNISDGETMKGVLAQGGYNITMKKEEADVWYSFRFI